MDNYTKGMSTIGQLFPPTPRAPEVPRDGSAWESVAKSFRQAGDAFRSAGITWSQ